MKSFVAPIQTWETHDFYAKLFPSELLCLLLEKKTKKQHISQSYDDQTNICNISCREFVVLVISCTEGYVW